jgi:hypothetical protein
MTDKQQLRWYTVWSDKHPCHKPEQIQEYRASEAASAWFNAHWCGLGRPDEARVHVRCTSGKVLVYDILVEDIELELDVTFVEFEKPENQASATDALDRADRATG